MQVQALSSSAPAEPRRRILIEVARRAVVATRADGVAIALRNGGDIVCEISLGIAPPRGTTVEPGSSLSAECIRTASPVYCADTFGDARYDGAAPPFRSVLLVPVVEDGRAAGFCGAFAARPNAFSTDHLHALTEVVAALSTPPAVSALAPATGNLIVMSGEAAPPSTAGVNQTLLREIESQIADWEKAEKRLSRRKKIAFAVVGAVLILTSITVAISPERVWRWVRPITAWFHGDSPSPSKSGPLNSQPAK